MTLQTKQYDKLALNKEKMDLIVKEDQYALDQLQKDYNYKAKLDDLKEEIKKVKEIIHKQSIEDVIL